WQFLANMSHARRIPLNAIVGYTGLMHDGLQGVLPAKAKDVVEKVQRNAGQLSIEDYSMNAIVHSVLAATASLAAAKNLPLEAAVLQAIPLGRGDERRLAQVLRSLGNAIKFTGEGEVRVAAKATNDIFSLSVVDTQPAIPAKQQARAFHEFPQVDSSDTNKMDATGLGLAIAKRIVELHGGRIGVEAQFGTGSTSQFELPVKSQQRMGVS